MMRLKGKGYGHIGYGERGYARYISAEPDFDEIGKKRCIKYSSLVPAILKRGVIWKEENDYLHSWESNGKYTEVIRKAQMPKDTRKHQHGLTKPQIKAIPEKLKAVLAQLHNKAESEDEKNEVG